MHVQPEWITSSFEFESNENMIRLRTYFEDDLLGRGDEKVGVFFYGTESFLDDNNWNGTYLILNEQYDKESTECIRGRFNILDLTATLLGQIGASSVAISIILSSIESLVL